jgi:hypothetical protein
MSDVIDALERIPELSSADFDLFRGCLRLLTSKTFIIRGVDKEGELFDFALRNLSLLEAWCACMDAEVAVDEGLGVVAFRGPPSMRFHFNREEICAVLALRLLYEDKKAEVTLTRFPVATVAEFKQKYNAATGGELKKTSLNAILSRLSGCRLIGIAGGDVTDEDALLELYPSIPMSIGREALDAAISELDTKKNLTTEGTENTEIDDTEDDDADA